MISRTLKPHSLRLSQAADGLAVALAVSLPWSTSATGILVGLWLLAFLPTLDLAALRRELPNAAVATLILLVALAALGILWSVFLPLLQGAVFAVVFTHVVRIPVTPGTSSFSSDLVKYR